MSTQDAQPVLPEPGQMFYELSARAWGITPAWSLLTQAERDEQRHAAKEYARAALAAQQTAEPVAQIEHTEGGSLHHCALSAAWKLPVGVTFKLYTHAPATPQAEPVTEGAREAFEAWMRSKPDARLWNTTDAMFAAFVGGQASRAVQPMTEGWVADCVSHPKGGWSVNVHTDVEVPIHYVATFGARKT